MGYIDGHVNDYFKENEMHDETPYQKLLRENSELRNEVRKLCIIVTGEYASDDDRFVMAENISIKYNLDI